MKILLNYADHVFSKAQKRNTKTGLELGDFHQVRSFGPENIGTKFRLKNKAILEVERGGGYWLWKPYFIAKVLDDMKEDDFLFYCDSGARFIGSVDPLVALMQKTKQDLICFDSRQPEKARTKRDAFHLMDCDIPKCTGGRQRAAGFGLWRATPFTIQLARDWLKFAQDPRILTDQPNECGLQNYKEYIEHRHDQSIFSLLAKRHRLPAHRLPSKSANNSKGRYPSSQYKKFIHNDRWRQ